MKKIPTLFVRNFPARNQVKFTTAITQGCEWALTEGIATQKHDGSCCAIINGIYYKRYDAKKGKMPPDGAIPCQPEADSVTGHFPHWLAVDETNPSDKWFVEAYNNTKQPLEDGTYEAVGTHFNANKDNVEGDVLVKHGSVILDIPVPRSFDSIQIYLERNTIEGIVFYRDNGDMCKIKRTDFGFKW